MFFVVVSGWLRLYFFVVALVGSVLVVCLVWVLDVGVV